MTHVCYKFVIMLNKTKTLYKRYHQSSSFRPLHSVTICLTSTLGRLTFFTAPGEEANRNHTERRTLAHSASSSTKKAPSRFEQKRGAQKYCVGVPSPFWYIQFRSAPSHEGERKHHPSVAPKQIQFLINAGTVQIGGASITSKTLWRPQDSPPSSMQR